MSSQASTSRGCDATADTSTLPRMKYSDSEDILTETNFKQPPEAPVFEPTFEQWKDPILFIETIRPIAEQFGICKIKPPLGWEPKFALNVDKFTFTPRIQRLNELEARTRVQLNFLDSIAKFWELQGSNLRIPLVERKALDLFLLHRLVKIEGGLENIIKERKWAKIALKMGYAPGRGLGTLLKSHYERILYPFDIFQEGKFSKLTNVQMESEGIDTDYKPHGILSRQAVIPPKEKYSRRSKRFQRPTTPEEEKMNNELSSDAGLPDSSEVMTKYKIPKKHNELKRLEFYGAAPKPKGAKPTKEPVPEAVKGNTHEDDPLAKYVCLHCKRGDSEESMLLCDGCDDSYHTFCLMPPLPDIPKGDWRCPNCIAKEVSKPLEAFGFEQAKRKYTLKEFGEMADTFKTDYFNLPASMVSCLMVEREFWRIVSNITEDVTVQYGADLHTMEHGSGFSTRDNGGLDPDCAESPWNLNNLPVLDSSVLGYINADISGMKVPWMYVGMCFAAFCWHNEDHWSYSINYLHWGEPKTWYGVPGSKAEEFEMSMRKAAPELFIAQPDLLHQLVTIINPNALMDDGIPVCRTDQRAGEFVVTFPRAYHAGFNQGYNFAEAVNFAPADWLPLGRQSIEHYSLMGRVCVFSHDELVCNMAIKAENLHVTIAATAYQDMLAMVDAEVASRKALLEWGVVKAAREGFELLPDDERQCDTCKTTCFLSAVTCGCTDSRVVCLRHFTKLCQCPASEHTLRYRYTLDELPELLGRLQEKAESFKKWCDAVTETVTGGNGASLVLEDLKSMVQEAVDQKYPQSDLLAELNNLVHKGDVCTALAQKLSVTKIRTRNRPTSASRFLLTAIELKGFYYQDLVCLPFTIREAPQVKVLVDQVEEFERHAQVLLNEHNVSSKALEEALEVAASIDIQLPDVVPLKHALTQARWVESLAAILEETETLSLEEMKRQLDIGLTLPPSALIEEKIFDIQLLMSHVDRFEEKAKMLLTPKYRQTMAAVSELLEQGENIPAFLPSIDELREAKEKGLQWMKEAAGMKSSGNFPYMDQLEDMVQTGRAINVRLDLLPVLEAELQAGKMWRERTARTFLRKNSSYTLMEALSPRTGAEIANNSSYKSRRNQISPPLRQIPPTASILNGNVDTVLVVDAFRIAEDNESIAMMRLRKDNMEKYARRSPDTPFCICHLPLEGYMLMCALCRDWFHGSCVPTPKSALASSVLRPPGSPSLPTANLTTRDMRYLCPRCLRSRRPRLETILSLLVTLQKLSVRVPEGEALQCLTERAMNWQDRARNILASSECTTALAQLSVHSQRLVEAAAREKTEKIINSELLKAASNPHLLTRVKGVASSQQATGTGSEDSMSSLPSPDTSGEQQAFCSTAEVMGFGSASDASVPGTSAPPLEADCRPPPVASTTTTSPSVLEHTYSSVSKAAPAMALPERPKHVRKTPHVLRQMDPPPLAISPSTHQMLELLMFEGDMLEVSLDELQLIYKIMHAANPKVANPEEFDGSLTGSDAGKSDLGLSMYEKNTLKKRMMGEGSGAYAAKRVKKAATKPNKGKKKAVLKEVPNQKFQKRAFPKGGMQDYARSLPSTSSAATAQQHFDGSFDNLCDDPLDDSCAAECCVHPAGKVDWVQCDSHCQLWFHLRCIGIGRQDVAGDKEYYCKRCKPHVKTAGAPGVARSSISPGTAPPTSDESLGLDALLSLADSFQPCAAPAKKPKARHYPAATATATAPDNAGHPPSDEDGLYMGSDFDLEQSTSD